LNAPSPTPQQQNAITARGNVLVVAGAGAGKTQTLVGRCLAWLLDEKNGASIDQILMVTFTQAAAAEMRQRLRQGLEEAKARVEKKGASSLHLAEQLALLDTAHIGTLHSFCFYLASRHFYDLGLDPKAAILPEERAQLLARQSLDLVLEKNYADETPSALAIQQLIQAQGGDWDKPVRDLIVRLHHYSQTLRDPETWFAEQTAGFQQSDPALWRDWLMDELISWRASWLPVLQAQPPANENAAQCAHVLAGLPSKASLPDFAAALADILTADKSWPRPKGKWRDPIGKMFDDAEFLYSVCPTASTDPLAEDWNWVRHSMLALLDLAAQFGRAFADAKRQESGMDYHDLEQFALRLLWTNGRPSAIAEQWRKKLRLVFVDEYQDINAAQEAIIQALGREGSEANRFLVGDVKQSIYRFRLADPRIFSRCHDEWKEKAGAQVIPLTHNFRSHEAILHFINNLFTGLMRRDAGGVEYDASAHLLFGNAAERAHLAARAASLPPVELHLRCMGRHDEESDAGGGLESASDAEKEARLVGRRLLEIKNDGATIFDGKGQRRPATWSDMVILLRSPRHKVEAYVKEFNKLGIPISATRGGFYESLEVRDLLALLQVLDNPLQDLPLLAVLHSPLVGLTADELATIRIGHTGGRYWTALLHAQKTDETCGTQYAKIHTFLERFTDWRARSRQSPVSHCLERVIDQTHYTDWLSTQERGEQKRANVERLLQLTRQFDAYYGESLYRFLKFVEAQQEGEVTIEPAAVPVADAVRLMSIHQSKGAEFPIVVVADLGKKFNFSDLTKRIILDEEYGICPQIKPPGGTQFYPSLPYWLAERRQKRELLGEEMRLLYVALTRAGQRLVLVGTTSQSSLEKRWPLEEMLSSRTYLDWIGSWLVRTSGRDLPDSGNNPLIQWTFYSEEDARLAGANGIIEPAIASAEDWQIISPELRERLAWHYPFAAETEQAAKTSVTTIRRQMAEADGDESTPLFARSSRRSGSRLSAAEIGSAHHAFLQWISLEKAPTLAALQEEAKRIGRQNLLTGDEIASLNLEAMAAFWQSEIGGQWLRQTKYLTRELPFTARFSALDLARLGWAKFAAIAAPEFVIVQGVMDLVAILPEEIWLLDFKTDHFPASGLAEKIATYRPQLALYAEALQRIYRRPVTKCWLHFLAHDQTTALDIQATYAPSTPSANGNS
jgi:ATP-dependent helicase/nuclease subunit A